MIPWSEPRGASELTVRSGPYCQTGMVSLMDRFMLHIQYPVGAGAPQNDNRMMLGQDQREFKSVKLGKVEHLKDRRRKKKRRERKQEELLPGKFRHPMRALWRAVKSQGACFKC
ncbi:Phosphatidylinositol N-Acetylglucosaminyltransferase Subunit Q [Manis pentadactyla]|nr:Phosphatidylinositol N-Acetylglucosaminyltransferase Subunit Q [Manis pentadactyla]